MPCSEGVRRRFGRIRCPHLPVTYFYLGTCLAWSSKLKMKAEGTSETSVYLYRTTRHCVPEDSTPHSHYCNDINLLVTKWSLRWFDQYFFVLRYFACDFVLNTYLYLRHGFQCTLTHGDRFALSAYSVNIIIILTLSVPGVSALDSSMA
jgi:hypothetical protein